MLYAGPIIDAHHHLWDLSLDRHPWITDPGQGLKSLGDLSFLRRDYLVPDYLADAAGQNVVGSVYIETVWDRARPPAEEVDWLLAQPRPGAIASRAVAWAPLRDPGLDAALESLAQRPVAGIRETVRWHPDPERSWAPKSLMEDPAWRAGVARLGHHGLLLDLLMNPYQAGELAALAAALPDGQFVVNHCCAPVGKDPESLAQWRAGLAAMARQPNIAIKISNQVGYAADPASQDAVTAVVRTILDAFGPARAMFGTDYPVQRRIAPYAWCCNTVRAAIQDLTAAEQRAIFHDNAVRIYGVPAT